MSSQHLHVIPSQRKWLVKPEGNPRLSSAHSTQASAIDFALLIALQRQSKVFVHNRRGQIKLISKPRKPIQSAWQQ